MPYLPLLVLAVASLLALPAHAADDENLTVNARLLVSARNADAAGVERALKDGAAVNSRNRLGESVLIIALKRNQLGIAKTMIDAGADVNQAALNGVTPLMAAA